MFLMSSLMFWLKMEPPADAVLGCNIPSMSPVVNNISQSTVGSTGCDIPALLDIGDSLWNLTPANVFLSNEFFNDNLSLGSDLLSDTHVSLHVKEEGLNSVGFDPFEI